ncbi:hypothetical protein [Streptomyces sp. NPDC093568]|uniref:hypothetical protein n=1 Tax=Streptomyces sp. NPDC093568 TaxID=3366041 RepID=UPI0037FDDD8B
MSDGYLSGAFRQPRRELEMALDEQTGSEQVTHALRAVLTRLAHAAEDDTGLDPTVRRQLAAAVDLLRAAVVGTLSAVRTPAVPPLRSPRPRRSSFRLPFPGFGGGDEEEERRWARQREEDLLRSRRPVVHTVSLLDQVRAALEAADRLVAESEPPPPVRVPMAWHEDTELVNLIRDLMTAHTEGDGDLALRHIDRLRKELALRHDIEVVDFDGTNEWLFTLDGRPGPADGRHRTVQPALTTGGRILRRGEAMWCVAEQPETESEREQEPRPDPAKGGPSGQGEQPGDYGGKEHKHG